MSGGLRIRGKNVMESGVWCIPYRVRETCGQRASALWGPNSGSQRSWSQEVTGEHSCFVFLFFFVL